MTQTEKLLLEAMETLTDIVGDVYFSIPEPERKDIDLKLQDLEGFLKDIRKWDVK